MASYVEVKVQVDKSEFRSLQNDINQLTKKTHKVKVEAPQDVFAKYKKATDDFDKAQRQSQKERLQQIKAETTATQNAQKERLQRLKEEGREQQHQIKLRQQAAQRELKTQQQINALRGDKTANLTKGGIAARWEADIKGLDEFKNANLRAMGAVEIGGQKYQQFKATLKTVGGEFQTYTLSVNQLTGEMYKLDEGVKSTNDAMVHQGDTITKLIGKVALWTIATSLFFAPIKNIKKSLDEIEAVDAAMVTYRKSTNATAEAVEALTEQSYKEAKALGSTASAYVDAVAEFGKAGYKAQAVELGRLALVTEVVGDTTADVAQQFLLATDKAYKFNGSIEELTKVLDGVNEIGNNFATNVQEIADGLGIVAPLAAQSKIEIGELAAALGTITAVTQRSGSEAARAFRALILNLRQVKGEIYDQETGERTTTESLSNTEKVLAKNNIAIREMVNGTERLREPMQIIADLSQKVKEGAISEIQLAEITTTLGGKMRSTQLVALIENFDMYQKMLKTYGDAAGSAMKELSIYMDSIEAKQKTLATSWAELTNKLLSPTNLKRIYDLGNKVVEFLTKIIDGLGGLKGVILTSMPTIIWFATQYINKLRLQNIELAKRLGLETALKTVAGGVGGLALTAGFTVLTGIISYATSRREKAENERILAAQKEANRLKEEQERLQEEAENAKQQQEEAQRLYSDSLDSLNEQIEKYLSNLEKLSSALEDIRNGTELTADDVSELIDLYPELASQVIFTANGFEIQASALRQIRSDTLQKYINTQRDYLIAQLGGVGGINASTASDLEALFGTLQSAKTTEEATVIANKMSQMIGGDTTAVNKILSVWAKIRLTLIGINSELGEQYDIINTKYNEQLNKIDEILDKKKAEKDYEEDIYNLKKAQLELDNAKSERTKKVLRGGEWVWESDQSAIESARKGLSSAQISFLESLKEKLKNEQSGLISGEGSDILDALAGSDLTNLILGGTGASKEDYVSALKNIFGYSQTLENSLLKSTNVLTNGKNNGIINNNGDTIIINGLDVTDKVSSTTLTDLRNIAYAYNN